MAYGYDKNVDYQKLIHQDLVNQDYRSAAIHEEKREDPGRGCDTVPDHESVL